MGICGDRLGLVPFTSLLSGRGGMGVPSAANVRAPASRPGRARPITSPAWLDEARARAYPGRESAAVNEAHRNGP
jgi:hypothetical protein